MDTFHDATHDKAHGYLFIDFTQECPDSHRVRTDILNRYGPNIYRYKRRQTNQHQYLTKMSMLPKSVQRSLPYIKVLTAKTNVNKKEFLCSLPSFVIKDVVEILYNIIAGNIDFESKPIKCLKPSKKPLPKLANTPKKLIPKLMNTPKKSRNVQTVIKFKRIYSTDMDLQV